MISTPGVTFSIVGLLFMFGCCKNTEIRDGYKKMKWQQKFWSGQSKHLKSAINVGQLNWGPLIKIIMLYPAGQGLNLGWS